MQCSLTRCSVTSKKPKPPSLASLRTFFERRICLTKSRRKVASGCLCPAAIARCGVCGPRRLLEPADEKAPGEARVVVLSYNYWRSRFNESATVLNQLLIVNGQPMTIVGVAPKGFNGTIVGM